jgi:hypothetical protein
VAVRSDSSEIGQQFTGQATPERFRDPRTGRVMRVWIDPGGARRYVAEEP